jgi:hypothetical protein
MKCIINFHPLQKYPKIGIFGIRINHLATLVRKSIVADHVMTVHIQFNFCCQKVTYSRMPCHAMSSRVVPYFHLHTWWAVITLAAKLAYIHRSHQEKSHSFLWYCRIRTYLRLGLLDGIFSYQKFQFGYISEGLGMEHIGIFHIHLEFFTALLVYFVVIRYIFWSFGIFLPFWFVVKRKIWQPCSCDKRECKMYVRDCKPA